LNKKGFTLIELTVVVFLVGLILLIAVPRVRDTILTDNLKSSVRYLVGTARELKSDAIRSQVDYVLHMDINNNLIWTYSADMTPEAKNETKKRAFHLPEGVKIADIYRFGKEKLIDGEATIRFFKKGYVQPTVVHLVQEDRYFTIVFEPFLNSTRVYDTYRKERTIL
jgi:prepilin-type N-terminal cleavage/methylation domain-containing protein